MSSFSSTPIPPASLPRRLAFVGLLVLLCAAAVTLALEADVASRRSGLRLWTLVGAGFFAMAPPNLLLPDPNTRLLQLLNWSPAQLLQYQGRRFLPVVGLVALPVLLIAYVDSGTPLQHLGPKTEGAAQALLLLIATALDSFAYFAPIGARSQDWQEGRAGQWYGRLVEEGGQGISLPRGLVPALFATTRCFVVAIGVLVASAVGVQSGSLVLAWGPGLALLGWAGVRLRRHRQVYDRHFYHTTAFYEEVLGTEATPGAARDPVPYESLYWVPSRWRPATWAGLRQLDRRLPLGRLVLLAHAGLWLLCLRSAPPSLVAGVLLVLFAAQTAAAGLIVTPAAAPRSFQVVLQSPLDWIVTRTFVNLRWLVPHAISLTLVALFDDTYGVPWVLAWVGVHIALSVGVALVATGTWEGRVRRSST